MAIRLRDIARNGARCFRGEREGVVPQASTSDLHWHFAATQDDLDAVPENAISPINFCSVTLQIPISLTEALCPKILSHRV